MRKAPSSPDEATATVEQKQRAEGLLHELRELSGVSESSLKPYLFLLEKRADHVDALETVLSIIASDKVNSANQIARAGLEWLDEMLAMYHAKELERPIRLLASRGCSAVEIAETLNDCNYDETHNGGQMFGEFQVRRACKVMGIRLAPVRWK